MVYENPRRVESRIRRLTKEIEDIDRFYYGSHEKTDRLLYMGQLELKRDDIVRSVVIQTHTSIEDLLTKMLFVTILGKGKHQRSKRHTIRGQALSRMLIGGGSLSFDMKLYLGVVVGVINSRSRDQLKELNAIRNKCSHNWQLNVHVPGKTVPNQKRPRLLTFRGQDLHKVSVLKDFLREMFGVYLALYAKTAE